MCPAAIEGVFVSVRYEKDPEPLRVGSRLATGRGGKKKIEKRSLIVSLLCVCVGQSRLFIRLHIALRQKGSHSRPLLV